MRCPKCHYLSFEPEPRCKNCGYDLAVEEGDLVIKAVADAAPLADLSLREPMPPRRVGIRAASCPGSIGGSRAEAALGGVALADEPMPISAPAAPMRTAAPAASYVVAGRERGSRHVRRQKGPSRRYRRLGLSEQPPRAAHATAELPLFVKAMPAEAMPELEIDAPSESDEPLVKVPAEPRLPLGVRRSSAETPKPRTATGEDARRGRKLGPFDRDLLDDLRRVDVDNEEPRQLGAEAPAVAASAGTNQAGSVRRLFAAAVDVILLAAMTAGVVWVTFRLAGVAPTSVGAPVLVPLGAFVLAAHSWLPRHVHGSGRTDRRQDG